MRLALAILALAAAGCLPHCNPLMLCNLGERSTPLPVWSRDVDGGFKRWDNNDGWIRSDGGPGDAAIWGEGPGSGR